MKIKRYVKEFAEHRKRNPPPMPGGCFNHYLRRIQAAVIHCESGTITELEAVRMIADAEYWAEKRCKELFNLEDRDRR